METPSNSVLVTGGRGFIGLAVRKLLQRSGYSVLALDQPEAAAPGTGHFSLGREIAIDITEREQLRSLFHTRPIAAIVHLAASLLGLRRSTSKAASSCWKWRGSLACGDSSSGVLLAFMGLVRRRRP
jgi:nucleoside-diphosphate-sugar epimerase